MLRMRSAVCLAHRKIKNKFLLIGLTLFTVVIQKLFILIIDVQQIFFKFIHLIFAVTDFRQLSASSSLIFVEIHKFRSIATTFPISS